MLLPSSSRTGSRTTYPIRDQSTGKKGLTIAVEPLHGEWTYLWDKCGAPWLQKGKDQKRLEKVSFRE